jgi:hypothetical protein
MTLMAAAMPSSTTSVRDRACTMILEVAFEETCLRGAFCASYSPLYSTFAAKG